MTLSLRPRARIHTFVHRRRVGRALGGSGTLDVIDSTTEERFATIPAGDPDDIDRAVAAARPRSRSGPSGPAPSAGKLLQPVADALEARRDEIAAVIAHEVGHAEAPGADRAGRRRHLRVHSAAAELAHDLCVRGARRRRARRPRAGRRRRLHHPWNYPLNQIGAKVAYALAAGCTVVLKPSEVAPVNAFILAEIIDEIGFPAGVFNLVSGLGPVVGEALAAHPDVDMVSFTGSTRAGKRVAELAAASVKKVALELGGKSPFVILDDADFADGGGHRRRRRLRELGADVRRAHAHARAAVTLAEVEEIAAPRAESYTVGDPFAENTQLGPLISTSQRDRVRDYIDDRHRRGRHARDRRSRGARRPRHRATSSSRPCSRTSRAT